MKILNVGRIAILASLALMSVQGCAQTSVKDKDDEIKRPDRGNDTRGEAAGFTFDKRGMPIPVNADGRAFSSCGTGDKNSCAIFNEKVTIKELETVTFTKVKYEVNPTCLVYAIVFQGKQYFWYDKNDPNCAKFN